MWRRQGRRARLAFAVIFGEEDEDESEGEARAHAGSGVRAVRGAGRGAGDARPAARGARRGGPRRGHRPVPQRLARLDGPRPGHRAAARPRPRTRRSGGGDGSRGHRLEARRPGHRALRVRAAAAARPARPAISRCANARPSPGSRTGAPSPSTWPWTTPTSTSSRSRTTWRTPPPPRSAAGSPPRSARSCTRAGVAAGEWVAVHGCGGVGLSAVMIAAASGARVVAVDVSPRALELARRFGATECVDATPRRRTRRRRSAS